LDTQAGSFQEFGAERLELFYTDQKVPAVAVTSWKKTLRSEKVDRTVTIDFSF